MDSNQTLDARGLNCPLPILRTKKSLNAMQSGDTLKVVATDPGSLKDMVAFCAQTGNTLLESQQSGSDYQFLIRKA
jgi:tRNA 2-thiouridine synthesizing protein A